MVIDAQRDLSPAVLTHGVATRQEWAAEGKRWLGAVVEVATSVLAPLAHEPADGDGRLRAVGANDRVDQDRRGSSAHGRRRATRGGCVVRRWCRGVRRQAVLLA